MTKMIKLEFDNGDEYHIPLWFVAAHRAAYYSRVDKDTTFAQEVKHVLDDSFEGIDWLQNNMDWEDFGLFAVKQLKIESKQDFDSMFINAEVSVIGE